MVSGNSIVTLSQTRSGEAGELHSKKELIETARLIAKESEAVVKMARKVAEACTDKRMKRVSVLFVVVLILFVVYSTSDVR